MIKEVFNNDRFVDMVVRVLFLWVLVLFLNFRVVGEEKLEIGVDFNSIDCRFLSLFRFINVMG